MAGWYCYAKHDTEGRGYVGFGSTRAAAEDDHGCPGLSSRYVTTHSSKTPGSIKAARAAQEQDGEV